MLALEDAFVALAPYVIVISAFTLLTQVAGFLEASPDTIAAMIHYTRILNRFLAIVQVVSLSYYFAVRFQTGRTSSILLSFMAYITIATYASPSGQPLDVQQGAFNILSLSVPIVSVLVFAFLLRKTGSLDGIETVNITVSQIYQSLVHLMVAYVIVVALFVGLSKVNFDLSSWQASLIQSPDFTLLLVRSILVQSAWFVGIQGSHLINSLLGKTWLMEPLFTNLSYGQFYRLFALPGGAGVGMALFLSLLLVPRTDRINRLLKFAWPFIPFNINTLLIYGVPVVYNRFLFIPFLVVPLVNMTVAYIVLSLFPVTFVAKRAVWSTPMLIDSYIVSGGNFFVVGLQFCLVLLSLAIYLPFVRKSCVMRSLPARLKEIEQNLDVVLDIEARENLSSYQAQRFIIESSYKVSKILKLLNEGGRLMVYYQPKVDVVHQRCDACEALLRLQLPDGRVQQPSFVEELEAAGMIVVIDVWVCKQVKQDLAYWRSIGFQANVSINLHPDTLRNSGAIRQITRILADESVEFEIVERSFLKNTAEVKKHLAMLGQRLAIDDFGVGFSSLTTVSDLPVDVVKLDKSLLQDIHDDRRAILYQQVVTLCKNLGAQVVAEGVETEQEWEYIRQVGVDYAQGFYFAEALPRDQFEEFVRACPGSAGENPPAHLSLPAGPTRAGSRQVHDLSE